MASPRASSFMSLDTNLSRLWVGYLELRDPVYATAVVYDREYELDGDSCRLYKLKQDEIIEYPKAFVGPLLRKLDEAEFGLAHYAIECYFRAVARAKAEYRQHVRWCNENWGEPEPEDFWEANTASEAAHEQCEPRWKG